MFTLYWLISEDGKKTYVGFSNDLIKRVAYHENKKVKSTKHFGKFRCFRLEQVDSLSKVIEREKYWKSSAGRKKLKILHRKIITMPLSSSG